jgi:hypothetical protein
MSFHTFPQSITGEIVARVWRWFGLPKTCRWRQYVAVNELGELPPGWVVGAWPYGWDPDHPPLGDDDLKRVGYVLLPTLFQMSVEWPELWPDGNAPAKVTEDWRGLIVTFNVEGDHVVTQDVTAFGIDLGEWLSFVTEKFPPRLWKAVAVAEITQFFAWDAKRKKHPLGSSTRAPEPPRPKPEPGRQRRSDGTVRRHRITKQHLHDVAGIYTSAVRHGLPPTRTVAEHYNVAHSTAAKWVSAARRNHLLPPAKAA